MSRGGGYIQGGGGWYIRGCQYIRGVGIPEGLGNGVDIPERTGIAEVWWVCIAPRHGTRDTHPPTHKY